MPLAILRGETTPLLDQAVESWLGERDNWAFTVLVREFEDQAVKEVRSERYDPSKPGDERWELMAINGNPPTAQQNADWKKRKTKKRKFSGKSLNDYLEFEHAKIVNETDKEVSFHVPLRNNNSWLFPVQKVELRVTVDKATQAINQVTAGIDEPFRVALGLARVLDVHFDVQINSTGSHRETAGDPATANPDGKAKVVLNKFGERVEYAWSDFKRVTPHPDNVAAANLKN